MKKVFAALLMLCLALSAAGAAAPPAAAGSLPKTGDPSMLGMWALLLSASAAGLKLRKKS